MHFHIGFMELICFMLYYVITKAVLLFVNIEFRRNKIHVPSAVSGLLS